MKLTDCEMLTINEVNIFSIKSVFMNDSANYCFLWLHYIM